MTAKVERATTQVGSFGGATLSANSNDIFVASYTPAGAHRGPRASAAP